MKIARYLLAAGALVGAIGATGAEFSASAQTTSTSTTQAATTTGGVPSTLPADQLVLNGSCIPDATILQTAEEAMDNYTPGSQPAGVYLNGIWIPAPYMAAYSGDYVVGVVGCISTTGVPTTVAVTTTLATTTTTAP
ncbi:MAG TPA: hypothetical protein VL984_14410 [Acidimicrobiales bacterium]|nr:hypothetical protein [Acidimicrobiales bacterium]